MIKYNKTTLDNGLQVIHHEDTTTPLIAINILYKVGSRNESPDKTGFAHLFEHLMFGGSVNIPSFDEPLQRVGGENNAFTNNDITNYYITIPSNNVDIALWLESDRMLSLAFSQKSLDVQKQVVIEEFNQRYLNQPYGDVWLKLRPMAYKTHPYQWPTIGKTPEHIENAHLDDVKAFFHQFYAPENAILVVSGNISRDECFKKVEKWFGPIPARSMSIPAIPQEKPQTEARFQEVIADVPQSVIYKAYHMPAKTDPNYPVFDLMSDVLSNGKSSRMIQNLVKDQKLFTNVNAYITGDMDPGLFIFQGNLREETNMEKAEKAFAEEMDRLKNELVSEYELNKVKNRFESLWVFGEMSILNKAMNLASFEMQGDIELINKETQRYRKVSEQQIQEVAKETFRNENASTLHYYAKNLSSNK